MSVYLLSLATQTPSTFFEQGALFELAGYPQFPEEERRKIQAIFRASGVKRRAMELDGSQTSPTTHPDDFHRRYLRGIRSIVPQAARKALERAGLLPSDIDTLVFVSCTGYTCPGYSAELAYHLGLRQDRPTVNLLGMGCSALLPGMHQAWNHLKAYPHSRALVIAAEICSATYWIDHDPETAVGNALFGDGCAALVLSSNPEDLTKGSTDSVPAELFYFRTLRDGRYLSDMGFTQQEGRLRVRLAREIPNRIIPLVSQMIERLEISPQERVAFHPGGRKILDLFTEHLPPSLQLEAPLDWARAILRSYGNMSSPTVAFVLEHSLKERPAMPGETAAMITLGPGLSVEGAKLRFLSENLET